MLSVSTNSYAPHLLGAQQRRQSSLRIAVGQQVHDEHGDVISAPGSLDGHLQHLRAARKSSANEHCCNADDKSGASQITSCSAAFMPGASLAESNHGSNLAVHSVHEACKSVETFV